jgi:hypothetical protein
LQKPHVLLRLNLPPCTVHCTLLTPVRHLPAVQQAPWLLLEQMPLWQLLFALKLPVHWLAVVSVHTPLLQHAACNIKHKHLSTAWSEGTQMNSKAIGRAHNARRKTWQDSA